MAHQVNNNFTNEFNDKNNDLCKTMLNKSEKMRILYLIQD